jgi:hypothetical protein
MNPGTGAYSLCISGKLPPRSIILALLARAGEGFMTCHARA